MTTGPDVDHYDSVEWLEGSSGDDVFRGTDAADTYLSSGGADDVRTYGGNDAIYVSNSHPYDNPAVDAPTSTPGPATTGSRCTAKEHGSSLVQGTTRLA